MSSFDDLFAQVYGDLRAMAEAQMRGQANSHTLSPTALVNEVYMKFRRGGGADPSDEHTLLCTAARAMRQILVDHARAKKAQRRGGDWRRMPLDTAGMVTGRDDPMLDIVALDEALQDLEKRSERKARIVELRCFAGLTVEEAANALGVARSTAADDWSFARAWLRRALGGESGDGTGSIRTS